MTEENSRKSLRVELESVLNESNRRKVSQLFHYKYNCHRFGPECGIHGYIIKEENEIVGMIAWDADRVVKFGDIWD